VIGNYAPIVRPLLEAFARLADEVGALLGLSPDDKARRNNVSQGQDDLERKVEEADEYGPEAPLLGGKRRPYGRGKGREADERSNEDPDLCDLSLRIRTYEVSTFDSATSSIGLPEAGIGIPSRELLGDLEVIQRV
jgi:hypothetical protein